MTSLPMSDAVPVYDCHVLLRRPSQSGETFVARCAAAPEITAEGATEREVLQSLVIRFKYFVQEHRSLGQPIPWHIPEQTPEPGEVERWVSVHL